MRDILPGTFCRAQSAGWDPRCRVGPDGRLDRHRTTAASATTDHDQDKDQDHRNVSEVTYSDAVRSPLDAGVRAARAICTPAGLAGLAVETAWVGLHLAIYPLGLVEETIRDVEHLRVEHLPPLQRGLFVSNVEAAGTPIILLHGVVDNRSIFTVLRRLLARKGFTRTYALNYSLLTGDLRAAAERLGALVEAVCEQTGFDRVHVVGHSMGGVIARYYVQRMGGDARVHTLVTLGSPHQGTWGARLIPWPAIRQLTTDSEFIAELQEPAPGCRTRFVAVWSDLDQVIIPQRNARIVHPDLTARNVLVRGVGHMSLPVNTGVAHEIARSLAPIDASGQAALDSRAAG